MKIPSTLNLAPGDALLIVDIQNDFLPGGSLAVPKGNETVSTLNHMIDAFNKNGLPIFATRDWHPPNHCSFYTQGGPWPPHCVAGTFGAEFPKTLHLPKNAQIISKATAPDKDGYSAFEDTDLGERLWNANIQRIYVGGLATDYCVLNTVRGARRLGFHVTLITDAVRAINVHPNDEQKALREMATSGVEFISQLKF